MDFVNKKKNKKKIKDSVLIMSGSCQSNWSGLMHLVKIEIENFNIFKYDLF